MIGNYGRRFSMGEKTTETVETFFESIDFLINSLLFILIGIELQTLGFADVTQNLRPLLVAIAALLLGLPNNPVLDAYRTQLLVAGFGVVFFSLVIQGITMKPLLAALKVSEPDS